MHRSSKPDLLMMLTGILLMLQGCAAAVLSTTGTAGAAASAAGAAGAAGAATAVCQRSAGTVVDDQVVEVKAIDRFLRDRTIFDTSHVNPTSYNGILLLTGETPTQALRNRAEELVKDLEKVRRVQNELAIVAPSSLLSRTSDTVITGKVKIALGRYDLRRIAACTKVVTENGVVYLMGLLRSDEADVAADIARKIGGVQRVVKIFEYME